MSTAPETDRSGNVSKPTTLAQPRIERREILDAVIRTNTGRRSVTKASKNASAVGD
jgi:hypothetical protein